jgi:hypothetical protein
MHLFVEDITKGKESDYFAFLRRVVASANPGN